MTAMGRANVDTSETKMSPEEMARYYVRLHREALARDASDQLSAVIAPDAIPGVNRFRDFAHRLGMNHAFGVLQRNWGSLSKRSVLDLGCGRGRWCREYAARGSHVTGVDISEDAIALLTREMPQHRFLAQDIACLSFPEHSFDVVNSVTVLQHMPVGRQLTVFDLAARWLKVGGYLVLLENICPSSAPHVFAHPVREWVRMVESTGLRKVHVCGSNFEIVFRAGARFLRVLRKRPLPQTSEIPFVEHSQQHAFSGKLKSGARALAAAASYPAEWACHLLPFAAPTHSVMLFQKCAL